MDGSTTAPDVIAGEASASVERPLARVPLVLNKRSFSWITDRISGVVEEAAPRWWWVSFTITAWSPPSVCFVSAIKFRRVLAHGD